MDRNRQDIAGVARAHPRPWLWAEFVVLYVVIPLSLALIVGRFPLFPVLLGFTVLAAVLLYLTPGFSPRDLLRGPVLGEWKIILGFTAATGALCILATLLLVPERLFELPRQRTQLWLLIMTLYPLLSALPQELIYRPLFFHRYGALFPNVGWAIVANGLAFGLAHLFFMNWVTVGMTVVGGLIFAWAYMRHGSFLLACILHAVAGQMIFTSGLGIFFYHGAIGN